MALPRGSVVVFASTSEGAEGFDAAQPFPVVRQPTSMLLPTPDVARRVAQHREDRRGVGLDGALDLHALGGGLAGVRRVGHPRILSQGSRDRTGRRHAPCVAVSGALPKSDTSSSSLSRSTSANA